VSAGASDEIRIGLLRAARHGGLCVLAGWAAIAAAQPAAPASVAAAAPAVALIAAPTEIKCGLLVDTPDGTGKFEELPDLHPLSQTGAGKTFTVDAPLDAGVMCGRSSVVPMPYDIQIAITGHAFYIIEKPSNRLGVLEIIDGICQYRMLSGELSAEEQKQLEPRLEEMQRIAAAAAG
jgi:hypothetical protein